MFIYLIYNQRCCFQHSHLIIIFCFFLFLFLFIYISLDSEVNLESAGLGFRPPSGFTDSREFSEAECDRERALDLEVQRVMENNDSQVQKIEREELTSLLAR